MLYLGSWRTKPRYDHVGHALSWTAEQSSRELIFPVASPSHSLPGFSSYVNFSERYSLIILPGKGSLCYMSPTPCTHIRKSLFAYLCTVWSLSPRMKTLGGQGPYLSCTHLYLQCLQQRLAYKICSSICWRNNMNEYTDMFLKCFSH